ncbi:MAG: TFIIB-type zinc finger domain-containing protein [Paracoccaceae bacterium]
MTDLPPAPPPGPPPGPPSAPPAPPSGGRDVAPKDEHRFPCDACGSDMRFDPGGGRMVCDHCGNVEVLQDSPFRRGALREQDFVTALRAQLPQADMEVTQVSKCTSCGAQVEFDPDQHAAECPFCATPVVTGTGEHRHIKPRGVVPFDLPEARAHEAMNAWLGKLWFAPNGLQAYARKGRKMSGIYVPYWTFDAQTRSSYSGMRGDDYWVTVRRGDKTVRERRTRWSAARGRVQRFFDDVLVLASSSLPQRHTEALEPWDLGALEPYQPQYLAGFRAEAYQSDLEESFGIAREKMDRIILRDVKFDIGGDRQRVTNVDTQVSEVTFKHILLPVWVAAYKYRGHSFRFVVNGQTGRVQGERPYSAWKIAFAVILGLIVAGIAGYLYAVSQGAVPMGSF